MSKEVEGKDAAVEVDVTVEGSTPAAETEAAEPKGSDKRFSQADLDRIAAQVRKDVKERMERERAEQDLAAQQKFEELAQTRATQRDQFKAALEAEQARVAELEAALEERRKQEKALLDTRLENVPAGTKKLLLGLEPAEALAWLSEHGTETTSRGIGGPPHYSETGVVSKETADALQAAIRRNIRAGT